MLILKINIGMDSFSQELDCKIKELTVKSFQMHGYEAIQPKNRTLISSAIAVILQLKRFKSNILQLLAVH